MRSSPAAACTVLAFLLLSGLAPLAGADYIGPRVKVNVIDNALNAGDATVVVVTIYDENGTLVPGATVNAAAGTGTWDDDSQVTNVAGSVNFIYSAPWDVAEAGSVILTFTAVYGAAPYTTGTGTVWVTPRPTVRIAGPSQILRGGAATRYTVTATSGGAPLSGASLSASQPAMGSIGATGGATDASGRTWFDYTPPSDRTGALTLSVNVTPPAGVPIQGILAIEVVDELTTIEMTLLSDRESLFCWGSCNLTATVARGGSPVMGASVAWSASRGWLSAASSTTDMLGKARVSYTAMGATASLWAGEALVNATATYQGATDDAQSAIDVLGLEVGWSADVTYRASAGQLYPGERLALEVDLDLPAGRAWEFITPLRVQVEVRDVLGTLVDTITLGEGIALRPGLHWTSGPRDILTVPASPTTPSYDWQLRVLSGNGLWAHYELPSPVHVSVMATGRDDWTFMIYYNGDSNLNNEMFNSIRDLEHEAPAGEFDVLFQTDSVGSGTERCELVHDGDPDARDSQPVWEGPEVDSGDGASLLDFMLWASSRAPAGHYCLVVWDHGGAYRGSSFDYNSHDSIDNAELARALRDFSASRRRLDVIAFDACLMSSVEVMHQLQGVASYMVGSETVVAGDTFVPEALARLRSFYPASRPTAAQVATAIIQGRLERGAHFPTTAIDLAAAATTLAALDAMGSELLEEWTALEDEFALALQGARRVRGPYGDTAWLVDAPLFLEGLQNALETMPMSWRYPDQIEAVETAREALAASIVDRIVPELLHDLVGYMGVNIYAGWTPAAYGQERGYYLENGLPPGHGWARLLDALFYRPAGGFAVFPPGTGFLTPVLSDADAAGEDDDGDGGFESLTGSLELDNSANSGDAVGFVDIVVYNGVRSGSPDGLVARKVFTVAAGARSTPSFTLTSPVDDLVDAVATVVAPDGTVLAQSFLGSFMMNATPIAGGPPSLEASASDPDVVEGEAISLSATVSDPDGDTVTVWWDMDAGDGLALDATGASATAVYRGAGNRTVVCMASDGANLVLRFLNITVSADAANRAPVANVTAEVPDLEHPMMATLDASGSVDPDGDALEYSFDLGDGNWTGWMREAMLVHEYATDGAYEVTVKVRDHTAAGLSYSVATVTVPAVPPNRAPVAGLAMSAASVMTGVILTADASSSLDPDGDVLELRVEWGDGAITDWTATAMATHAYAVAGSYTIILTVRDPLGLTASASRTIEVTAPPPNHRPTAILALSATSVEVGTSVTVDASNSTDPDAGDSLEARFDWGDGNATAWGTMMTASHAYAAAGTYTVTLEVRDQDLLAHATDATVAVTAKPDGPDDDGGFIPAAGAACAIAVIIVAALARSRRRPPYDPRGMHGPSPGPASASRPRDRIS